MDSFPENADLPTAAVPVECADGTLLRLVAVTRGVLYAIFAIRTVDYLTVFDVCPTETPHTVVQ